MNFYPNIKIIFDRRKKSGPNKEGSVEIEIYFKSKRKWISTGVKVLPKHWSDKNYVKGRVDAIDLNHKIKNIEVRIDTAIRKLVADNQEFSWDDLLDLLDNSKETDSFINFVEKRVLSRQDITESTRKNHKKFLKALKEFNIIRDFSHLTKSRIYKYDEWLRNRKTYTQSTIASYHKYLKVYINEALRMEKISVNPYLGIKIDRGTSRIRKYLTEEEVHKIESVNLPTETLIKARDVFIFQCYTALAYADLVNFDFRNVVERDGRHVLYDKRQKTSEEFYIVLLPPALKILQKYDFRLPLMSNQQYNMRLKIIAETAGIDKKLTSHMGRHTYATMSLNAGISIEVLAKMMGHADIKTTQIYAHLINNTVEEAYDYLCKKIVPQVPSNLPKESKKD